LTVSRINNQTKKAETKPWHQNRKIRLWIGLTLLILILALVAASLAAYFLTGKANYNFCGKINHPIVQDCRNFLEVRNSIFQNFFIWYSEYLNLLLQ
jgi:hypothetical protein